LTLRSTRPASTKRRALLTALVWSSLVGGCVQELDPDASKGSAAPSLPAYQDLTPWQICASPSCDSPDGNVPTNLGTPLIYLPDGAATSDPCDEVESQSIAIRQAYCATCHQPSASQGGLGFILDDGQLAGAYSQTALLPDGGPQRLLIPGDPYDSRLYQQVAAGLSGSAAGMPPTAQAGYPTIPRPSVSDVSVLYAWIVACVPGGGGYVNGGTGYGPGAEEEGGPGDVGPEDGGGD
jgi:hypothetical protein